jgi:hypothetical protein
MTLGFTTPPNPLGVPRDADHFGDPQHDVPHWNETTFFEAWSPDTGVGVFVHLGRYPGDLDLWWCQAITYLPEGHLTSDISWHLPGDTIVLDETPVRITDQTGSVGYGHLERAVRLDQARTSADRI